MTTTRGVLFIHSVPSAMCPHVEWAVGGVFGMPTSLDWTLQPVERKAYRAEYSFTGEPGTAAELATQLKGWQKVRFEVTEEPTSGSEGVRYSYTPALGIFCAQTGMHGDILIPEDRLKAAVVAEAMGGKPLALSVDELLGKPWDDELESFRHASDDAPVRWLHEVV